MLLQLLIPVVAVMPFRDLSADRGHIGEAIRETVTADLHEVAGLRVVERGDIDRVIAEQNLKLRQSNLDAISSVRVGTLLGASLLVSGAYQRVGDGVRLTARFIDVASGEVKGSAKVGGAAGELLALQDRVTVKLLASAGIGEPQQKRFVARAREQVSLKTFELYGDAVTEPDAHKRQAKLKATLDQSPRFSYASRDLDALERRVTSYTDEAHRAQAQQGARELGDAERALSVAHAPDDLWRAWIQLFNVLRAQHRYHRLIREARRALAEPPPTPKAPGFAGADSVAEIALRHVADAHYELNDDDGVLASEEEFMRRFPASRSFQTSRWRVEHAIANKRAADKGRSEIGAALAALSDEQRRDPCRVAREYYAHDLFLSAMKAAEDCADTEDPEREASALQDAAIDAYKAGQLDAARALCRRLRALSDKSYERVRFLDEDRLPPEDDR